jgi:hypothetical protein
MTNYGNLITDAAVVNNWDYLDGHIRYLYNLGIKQPTLDSRVLVNQVLFADSCNFNNIYLYCVPALLKTNPFSHKIGYLSPGLKDSILSKLDKVKMSTVEIVFQDPVYYGIGFGAATQDEVLNKRLSKEIINETVLEVVRRNDSSLNLLQIRDLISKTILEYFNFSNVKLGQMIDIQLLSQKILNIEGVENIYTKRNGTILPGLNLLGFNTVYSDSNEDIQILSQNTKLEYFKIPFWFNSSSILNQINVVPSELLSGGVKEY